VSRIPRGPGGVFVHLDSTRGFILLEAEMAAEIIRQEAFEDMQLAVIEHQGEEWFTAQDIGRALGFADKDSVHEIHRRNLNEFEGLSTTLKVRALDGKDRKQRVFNLQAVQKFGFFAQTPRAKAFRHWASKLMAHGVHQMKDHILHLEDQVRRDQEELSGIRKKLAAAKKTGVRLRSKLGRGEAKALPAPPDPDSIKVHRRDFYDLKYQAQGRDPRNVHIMIQFLEAIERGERLDLTLREYPRPHDSLLHGDTYRNSSVWRLLKAFGNDAEVQQARREVEYTAHWIAKLHDLYDDINKAISSFCGLVRAIPSYMDTKP